MNEDVIHQLAARLGERLLAGGAKVTTAESCTGGGIAYAVTEVAGSSKWFDYGFVTYSNEAKQSLLGVHEGLLRRHGAVSEEVARAMVVGAVAVSSADFGVAVTGIAGPGGGTAAKPVGTVWLAWSHPQGVRSERHLFHGDRRQVRERAIVTALNGLLNDVEKYCTKTQ